MSDSDPRPLNPPAPTEPHRLPAIPQPAAGALGAPMPAVPWIDTNERQGGFNFAAFLHSLRRRWLTGLGIGFLLASLVSLLLWFLVSVKYEAFVAIRVSRAREQALGNKYQRAVLPQEYDIEKQTQAGLIKSPMVINAALRQPGISQLSIVRDEPWPWMGQRENPVAWLQRELKVRYDEGSELLYLSMREKNPDELTTLLDAITDAYMREEVEKTRLDELARLERLNKTKLRMQQELKAELGKLGELAKTYGSPESEQVKLQLDMLLKELMSREQERVAARKSYSEVMDLYYQQQARIQAGSTFQPRAFEIEDMLLQYPEYAALKTQLVEMEQAMNLRTGQLRGAAGAGAGMQAQIAALKNQMEQFKVEKKDEAIQRLKLLTNQDDRALQQDLRVLNLQATMAQKRLDALDKEMETLREKLRQMGMFSVDLEAIEMDLKQREETAKSVGEEIEALQLLVQSKPQIKVLQTAQIPDVSNWIMKYLQIIAAWFLTLGGTVLALAFWDMQSKRVNNTQEVVDTGDIRVIGTLPLLQSRRAGGLLPLSETGKRLIEVGLTRSIDSIRTALLYAKSKRPYEIVMVSSALGQEGKTTVASQLAVSFARSGRRTLLIDGDLRNPQQHVVLGMPFQQGLCELLRGDATLDEVIQPTPAEGLWALSAGYRDGNTDQLLATSVLGKVFAELRQRFDLVVIDTGPVLTSPDAMLLGQHVDGTLIAVRRDVSRLPKVTEACNRLRSVGIQVAGAVVNGEAIDIRKSELKLSDQVQVGKDPQLERVV